MNIRYGSVCSGIEAATAAWHVLGWNAAWFAEIEAFPSAVLAHHYPEVPNLGDMTQIAKKVLTCDVEAPDVLVGGTPCQAFSVAGMRAGLNDPRGELTIKYVELANAVDDVRARSGKQPSIIVWENVPGVLSDRGNAFGCFLGALAGEGCELEPAGGKWTDAGCVYGPQRTIAWRVLDAQYFGLAQRRRRVFLVASARSDFDPCAVLFERDSVRRDFAPSREEGENITANAGQSLGSAKPCTGTLMANAGTKLWIGNQEALSGDYHIIQPISDVIAFDCKGSQVHTQADGTMQTLRSMASSNSHANGGGHAAVAYDQSVRRLTPTECERLQGFPDGYTAIPWRNKTAIECPDGLRYKALGNSKAVPVVRWVGQRIANELSK